MPDETAPDELKYPPGITNGTATVAVFTRDLWGDEWQEREDLHCVSCTFAAAPSVGTARFHHRYGLRYKSNALTGDVVQRLSINPRSYVKVEITPTPGMTEDKIIWVGIWKRATDAGLVQSFEAVGLESLLSFTRVDDAYYRDVFGGIKQAGRGITFNDDGKPNRSENKHALVPGQSSQAYCFDEDPERAKPWSTRDIVEYLLAAHPPLDKNGNQILIWGLFNKAALPNYDRPEVKAHDRDLLSLLHGIVARFRLLSFRLSVLDVPAEGPIQATNAAVLNVFTFTDTAISLQKGDGTPVGAISQNDDTIAINLDHDTTARASMSIDASHVADKVTVIGDARISVFSASKYDNSLDKAWTDDDEADHKAGASFASDYPIAGEKHDRQLRDKEARASDRLSRVFSWFRLPKYWEQKTNNGIGEGEATPIAIDDEGEPFRIPAMYLELRRELPLLTGYDYADDIVADAQTAGTEGHRGTKKTDGPHEPLSMLLVTRQPELGWLPGDPTRWVFVDQIGRTAALEPEDYKSNFIERIACNRDWSARVRQLKDVPGFEVQVSGAEQHVIAGIEYANHDDYIIGSWSWQDFIATVAVTDSRRVQVSYPEETAAVGEFANEMTIEAGEQYQLVYIAPQTVVGIDETTGELIRSSGGYLQDDRDALRVIAQRAYEWYKVPRYQLSYSTTWIDGRLSVGMYVSTVRRYGKVDPVGSVVTSITYEFPMSNSEKPDAPRCEVQTAFGELDAGRIL